MMETFFIMRNRFVLVLMLLQAGNAILAQKNKGINGFELNQLLIPRSEIYHGGPPKDGIPSIDHPIFLEADQADFLDEKDGVLGVEYNGVAKAYPIRILNYHEVVNDHFQDHPIVITYCPLCGSGLAFDAEINGGALDFGVSGLLYNSDVLLYDRQTESLWSQLLSKAVAGTQSGQHLALLPTANTTWAAWKSRYPNTKVLSIETGYNRDYQSTPYVGYENNPATLFPVKHTSRKLPNKAKVVGVELNGKAKAYPLSKLRKLELPYIDEFAGQKISIHFDKKAKAAIFFDAKGEELPTITLFWFAWYAFHPDTIVFSKPKAKD